MISQFFKKIFLSGVNNTSTVEEARQLEFTNKALTFFMSISTFYTIVFSWMGNLFLTGVVFVNLLTYIFCVWLNHKGYLRLSNFLIILETSIAVSLASAALGRESTGHYFLCFLIPLSALLFKKEARWMRYSTVIIPVIAFLCLEVIGYQINLNYEFSTKVLRFLSKTVFLATSALLLAITLFYIESFNHLNKTLKQSLDIYPLTERELEIINVLKEGKSNKEIAESLYIEESTVKSHLKRIYKKLGVKSRTELLHKCLPGQ